MATLGQMQTAISERLLDPSNTAVSLSTITNAINDAIGYWKFRRFWFNQAEYTSTMIANDPVIYLPSDFLIEVPHDGFVITYSDNRYPLTKVLPQQYDNAYCANGSGLPRIYTRKQDYYNCYPIPDQAYSCNVYYLKEYAALVNSSDTNDFTDNAHRMIGLWTLANLMAELRQDDKMETYYRAAAESEYKNLGLFTAKANPSGNLVINTFL